MLQYLIVFYNKFKEIEFFMDLYKVLKLVIGFVYRIRYFWFCRNEYSENC